MPVEKTSFRMKRIAEVIQRELAAIIHREAIISDFGIVTISDVEVSKDISHAIIHVSLLDAEQSNVTHVIDQLNQYASYMRGLLGKRVSFKFVPKLLFKYDATQANGERITSLIDKALSQPSSSESQ